MTVEVETDDGARSGYSVVEVGEGGSSPVPGIPGNGYWVRGEAAAVDVGPGKTLFALLAQPPERGSDRSWYQARLFIDALHAGAAAQPPVTLPGDGYGAQAHKAVGRAHAKLTLPEQLYPLLVTFGDRHDPKSVERVDPANLAATLGPGVRLKAITLEVTEAPVTTGIQKRLVWLPHVYELLKVQDFHPTGIPLGNFKGLFSTELKQ